MEKKNNLILGGFMDGKKILIIEDDLFIRELYERQLSQAEFEIRTAADAEEGMLKLKEEVPDLILLDIMLPKTNGLDFLKTIKKDEEFRDISVVLLTNLGQDAIIKEGFELGAEGYLIKSAYTPNQVVEEVKNFLDKKGSS